MVKIHIIPSASDEGCGRFLSKTGFRQWHLRTLIDLFEFALIDETMPESDNKYEVFKSWSYEDLFEVREDCGGSENARCICNVY